MHLSDKSHLEAKYTERVGRAERVTRESSTVCSVNLGGTSRTGISTDLPSFDHMSTIFGSYGNSGPIMHANGNTEVDAYHTVKGTDIMMGQAFAQVLRDKSGICRFGDCYIPVDEALAHAVVGVSGRPYFTGTGELEQMLTIVTGGHYATIINEHSFESLALSARIALHVCCPYGCDPHHIAKAEYRTVTRALRTAIEDNSHVHGISSTKGTLWVAAETSDHYGKPENLPQLTF